MFKEIKEDFNYPEMEKRILSFWEKEDIFHKSIRIRKDAPNFIFFEGPPTANGRPGIHHVISRTIKDLVCRYKTMQGFKVERKAGWDTHGLPVEIEVEKELELDSKAKIEELGIDKFCDQCHESVFRYKKEWDDLTTRIGYWLDLDKAYITCSNEYIESVWWILSQFWEKGLIYQGHRIVPYCPRCGTPLSSHEVAQGYEEVSDPSVYVKMKLCDQPNTYFLVWTTTPWTLISNVALAVGPDIDYVKVEHKGQDLILAEALLDQALDGGYKIKERFKGKELEKLKYEPLYSFVKTEKSKAFYVILADFVSVEEGTGMVHIAPAFGADDYEVGRKYDLPVVQPVDTKGEFTDEVTPWKGLFVKDADESIMEDLKKRKLLYRKGEYRHTYPFCWRCESPLIYYARKSWYIKTTAYKDKLLGNNKKINWYPPEIGSRRFGEWLENNVDWALSRERFWGTPLNIWVCDKCGEKKSVSSIEELLRLATPDEFLSSFKKCINLHKPVIDTITLKCSACEGIMRRTPEVIDCWFDSGSMPYAQWHYPFEHKEDFKEKFPAEFISEAIDQTRGWFYSLLAISSFISGEPAYKNVIVIELIQDKDGFKMSKSKGNVVDPWEVLDVQGADALRWYLLSVSHPWLPTRIIKDAITEVEKKFLSTLRNTYSFFALYANIDKFNPGEHKVDLKDRPDLDRWTISKLNSLVRKVTSGLDNYDLTRSARQIQEFVIEDLSNWYVRRSRRRFWQSAQSQDKISAYLTLWESLVTVCKLIAPYTPFIAEELFQELSAKVDSGSPESVHLTSFPKAEERYIDNGLEERMEVLRKIASLSRAARNRVGIKIRQPLAEILAKVPKGMDKKELKSLSNLVVDEVNVKKISFVEDDISVTELVAKPNFGRLGPKFGKKASLIAEKIRSLGEERLKRFKEEKMLKLELNGEIVELGAEDLEIGEKEKEGVVVESENEYKVALFTTLTEELKDEGFARELVNKIQNMRRSAGFEVMDRIKVDIKTTPRLNRAIEAFDEYIKAETLAKEITKSGKKGELSKEWDINGEKAQISVARIKR
ncbi:MAG: isoleucyl-tRNA synthase [candidate division Zixibacteria bacterium SM1_73]|nr:MAG: isoleucyl-tRNA synthase [candidate division Zixibacteria bacterium SM1_73]